jgi:hypothetical protein
MDQQTLQNKLDAFVNAIESAGSDSFKYSEFADAISQKYNELFQGLGDMPKPESNIEQTIAQKFEIIRQRVELNASMVGTDESIFKGFLTKAQETVSDIYAYISGVVSGIFGDEEHDSTPETPATPPAPPAPQSPNAPTMTMAEVPTPPPLGGNRGTGSYVPPPPAGRNDRVGPGSNFSKTNIVPSDTQQYLRTFDSTRRALDKEMKDRGYQKVGPGGLRREGDGSIRRKSQYGGAVGSLSNFLGDIGNTLTKNRRVKP